MIGSGDNAVILIPPPNLPPFTWKSICVSVPARSISKQTHKRSLVWRSTSPMPTVVQVPAHILTPVRSIVFCRSTVLGQLNAPPDIHDLSKGPRDLDSQAPREL